MSVRGEFRRLGGDLLTALRDGDPQRGRGEAAVLAQLIERAERDLTGAAEDALVLLGRLDAVSLADAPQRRRFDDAYERLEAVCRIILGR